MVGPAPALEDAAGRFRADIAIVGAGVAGLFAAIRLPNSLRVLIVDKGEPRSGSSPLAQGGMAVALGPDDSPDLHAADTLRAGDGLCDPVAVRVLAEEGPQRTRDLIDLGARFDRVDGAAAGGAQGLHLAREGGQSVARSVHRADATGAEMVRCLRAAAAPRVSRLQGLALALDRGDDGTLAGLWVLDQTGEVVHVAARAVLLATGGCGGLFAATTNRDHATGDGVALAHAAGAAVRDLEFVQFHPTGLAVSGAWRLLLTEALRGAGATLHDRDGVRFLAGVHPDAELAPRHVVAKAILDQPGGAWLDATHLGEQRLSHEFPTVLAGARRHGFDLATTRVPVTPAAHYLVGGVRTDLHSRTSLPRLYAAGEVAATGVHGANRMAGNSLTEALVFAARAAQAIAGELGPHGTAGPAPDVTGPVAPGGDHSHLRAALRDTMWKGCGPVRDAASLDAALTDLDQLADRLGPPTRERDLAELQQAVAAARLLVDAARLRTESRGGHWRLDHPQRSPAWDGVHLERVG